MLIVVSCKKTSTEIQNPTFSLTAFQLILTLLLDWRRPNYLSNLTSYRALVYHSISVAISILLYGSVFLQTTATERCQKRKSERNYIPIIGESTGPTERKLFFFKLFQYTMFESASNNRKSLARKNGAGLASNHSTLLKVS